MHSLCYIEVLLEAKNKHINQLINRCKKKDSTAQMEVYKNYYKAMYNVAHRILRDAFEAEDIMQEAFLTAFTKLDSFKGEVTFGAWLKAIVVNKSLTQLKKNKRYNEVKLEIVRDEDTEETPLNYSNLKANNILDSLNKLKDNYRIILTLHLIEGYDYEEIAQILTYTNENVRTTIFRAKKKLKQVILVNQKKQISYE